LLHRRHALLFLVGGITATLVRNTRLVDVEVDLRRVQPTHAGIADGRQDASQVRVGGEECGLYQRGMSDGIRNALAFTRVATALDLDGDELRGALAVAHDRLREAARDFADRHLELEEVTPARRRRSASRRGEDQRVIGGRIAVYGDA